MKRYAVFYIEFGGSNTDPLEVFIIRADNVLHALERFYDATDNLNHDVQFVAVEI